MSEKHNGNISDTFEINLVVLTVAFYTIVSGGHVFSINFV